MPLKSIKMTSGHVICSKILVDLGSADKTAKRYDRMDGSQDTFQHPDFVKDVAVYDGYLYTACSDENIRKWSLEVSKIVP